MLPVTVPERTAIQQAQGACVPLQAWRSSGASEAAEAFDTLLDLVLERALDDVSGLGLAAAYSTGTEPS